MKEQKVFFKNSKGQKLFGILYVPEGKGPFPAIVHVHGFGGRTFEPKIKFINKELTKSGFVSLQFDMFNKPVGKSEPDIEYMTVESQLDATKSAIDFLETLDYVDKNKIGLTGHSRGGMTVLIYAPTDKRIKSLVSQSATSNFKNTHEYYVNNEGLDLKKWKETGWRHVKKSWGEFKLSYDHYEDGLKYDVYAAADKTEIPTLVIHGDEDKAVPLKQSKELVKHLKNGKLEIIKGADHNYRINNTLPVATKLIVDWFKRYLK